MHEGPHAEISRGRLVEELFEGTAVGVVDLGTGRIDDEFLDQIAGECAVIIEQQGSKRVDVRKGSAPGQFTRGIDWWAVLVVDAEEAAAERARRGLPCAERPIAIPFATDRKRAPRTTTPKPRAASPRALDATERRQILDALHSAPLVDKAPAEASATLLDDGNRLCSIRTMYRILDANKEARERRDQLRHPAHTKPQLMATAPNQVWSWDITKLLGPRKWTYYHLSVVIDIYSRYVVGWMLTHRECQHLAERLLRESAIKEQIRPDQLTIHADRGPAMTSRSVSQLMGSLGISKSHSRPHTSNDNPYSESQFKTIKYHPAFPDRFDCFDLAEPKVKNLVPDVYGDPATSPLKASVVAGKNAFEFKLDSKAKKGK